MNNFDDRQIQHQYSTLANIPQALPLPSVILLDAVGTLFGVRDSVGTVYSQVAAKYGADCAPDLLDRCFYKAFKNSDPCIFPHVPPADIPQHEYQWWHEINRQTFTTAGVWEHFSDFDAFFGELYGHFTTTAAWELYPDVVPTLTSWLEAGVELGVLSNFDSRLYAVLKALDLERFFSTVTISTAVNAAKPQAQIFTTALAKYRCSPQSAWYIGDSFEEDYLGATQVGMTAIWLNRK